MKVKHSKNPFGTPKETLLKVFSQIKTITAKEDLLSQLRNQLLISLARKHKYKLFIDLFIFDLFIYLFIFEIVDLFI